MMERTTPLPRSTRTTLGRRSFLHMGAAARGVPLVARAVSVIETNPDAPAIADRLDAERKAGRLRRPIS